jgi:hypothetical protein
VTGGPGVEDAGDVDVVHRGQGLPLGLETGNDLAEGQEIIRGPFDGDFHLIQVKTLPAAAAFEPPPAANLLDQDAAHGLGSRGEEVATAIPVLRLLDTHQPEVRLMHQGGRLEGLAGLLLRQALGRQPAQLVVDQRQQLLGGVRFTVFDSGQDASQFTQRRLRVQSVPRPSRSITARNASRQWKRKSKGGGNHFWKRSLPPLLLQSPTSPIGQMPLRNVPNLTQMDRPPPKAVAPTGFPVPARLPDASRRVCECVDKRT